MPFDGISAAVADVEYRTNLGVFRAEQEQVQAVYARTTGAMTDEALKLSLAQERLNRTIAQQGPESYAAARATVAYRATLNELATSETAAAAASERAARQRLAAYTAAAHSVGSTLTRYVTVPTALASAAAVKLAFDFEGSMRLIQTQAGASAGEVNVTSDAILKMVRSGDSFGQTANDMAKGLFAIESEGVRGARAIEILRVASAGAAVGNTDLAQTANALTSAMRVYDVSAGGAAQTQATLNAIVGAGKLHLEDLVAALSTKYLPVAKQLGIPLDQAGAALDVFTRAGIPAESAATNLTTALLKILSPSKAAEENLAALGLDSNQLAHELQQGGLTAAIGTLAKQYDQLVSSQGKVAANKAIIGSFGGVRGGASVLTLVQQYDQYLKGLDQIQKKANPGEFWKAVAVTMHEPANQVHQDIAKISGDLILVGEKLAPVAADITGFVSGVADAFDKLPGPAKEDAAAILLTVAALGLLVKIGEGTIHTFQAIGRAGSYISTGTTRAVAQSDEQLAILRANAAETAAALEAAGAQGGAGLATGIGAGVAKSEAELTGLAGAETAAGAGGLLGRVGGLGRLTGLRAVGTYGIGGLVAGQIIGGVVPGQAGKSLSAAAEYAGLGAALGSFFPGAGTAIGAGLGATVGAVTTLIHSGPSFVQQVDAMGQSFDRFDEAAAASAHAVTQLHGQIANDRVARDQARQELQTAHAEERATRGTRQHAAAVNRLRAAQANLHAADEQIVTDNHKLTQTQRQHAAAVRKTAEEEATLTKALSASSVAMDQNQRLSIAMAAGLSQTEIKTRESALATGEYIQQMTRLADSAQSSNPKLAAVARQLAEIAKRVHHIPSHKTVTIIVRSVYEATNKAPASGDVGPGDGSGDGTKPSGKDKPTHRHYVAPFTVTIPVALQINLQRAENAGDVAAQRKYLEQERAFLEAELRKAQKAHNKQEVLQALQAIGDVDSQLQSLQSSSTSKSKNRTKSREKSYLAKVEEERRKLQINEQRAQLAEKKAGDNKRLLDRAYRAERRAVQDEIEFYRKEAHDKQLTVAERQRYARLQIAAEEAKLKIGKHTVQQTAALKQAEAQILVDLQTILQNYAGNFAQKQQEERRGVDVTVHQHFPSQPWDHHRQGRNALIAMRAAFDS